ncbi:flagellar export protein FliJ [Roseospira goensis]|uniref:Flagellar FliJ protein n=1 Tax=Roseospira goensis TaxID=391922 RepID=A0A7W6S2I6_9PROT|nr:flagellar export protein FliJ [Roseospira goensis]MBB4286989.1 flagellar export protein FliJ [Roseospira goensis]
MAKGDLHTVIRLNKLEIDELRRQLGVLHQEEAALQAEDRRLDADLARESGHVDAHPEAAFTFPGYLAAHRQRKDALAQALADLRQRIERMRDDLAELYRTRKTYELAQEARDARTARERARKDQAVLDEIGLTMHRRRRAEDGEDDPGGH